MKKYLTLLIALGFILVLVVSCVQQQIFYHSEAELPYFHKSTQTEFKLINGKDSLSFFNFGIISAKDNDTLSYLLFSPGKYIVKKLRDVKLNQSVTLLTKEIQEFLTVLKKSYNDWDTKHTEYEAMNYEFIISPENLITQESENVYTWLPVLMYNYHNNDNGPLATLILGHGRLKYIYYFKKRAEIKSLINILTFEVKNSLE